jgi:hypothetical protein
MPKKYKFINNYKIITSNYNDALHTAVPPPRRLAAPSEGDEGYSSSEGDIRL